MKLRRIILPFVVVGIGALGTSGSAWCSESKPNIVLIMADDQGAECLSSYGGRSYSTPHLDQMAENGMQFQNAYCPPVCTPTRVQLMTGQYPFRNGWPDGIWTKPKDKQFLDPNRFNFASMLKKAGYKTAVAGKWQLARFEDRPHHARNLGFDKHCLWTWLYSKPIPGIRLEGNNKPSRFWDPGIWQNGAPLKGTKGRFGPDIFTEFLLDFIRRNQDDPFFVYYPMALVHWPFVPPPGADGDKDGTRQNPKAQENFGKMVNYMDGLVGRFLDTLTRLNLREETLILFTGDNGTARSIRSQWKARTIRGEKSKLTEAGTRVPLLANWPGVVPEGRTCNDLVDLSDFLPTFAEVADVAIPENVVVDGRSFLPQLKGKPGNPRNWVFCQLGNDWFIQDHQWRLWKGGKLARLSDRYDASVISRPFSDKAKKARSQLHDWTPKQVPGAPASN